jgi:hypothetical protein
MRKLKKEDHKTIINDNSYYFHMAYMNNFENL